MHRFSRGVWLRNVRILLYVIAIVSVTLYILPCVPVANKFYLLPARLWEFAVGGILAIPSSGVKDNVNRYGSALLVAVIILMLVNGDMEIMQLRLILTVVLSVGLVHLATRKSQSQYDIKLRAVAYCGAASYSLYLWHQVILAFYRYVITSSLGVMDYIIVVVASFAVGVVSYRYLEKPLARFDSKLAKRVIVSACVVFATLLTLGAGFVYKHHGIVRDIPELDIKNIPPYVENQDYNARNMTFDKDYADNKKKNILVLGNSYGRDWINVLRESGVDSIMNISYHQTPDDVALSRIHQADFVFVATNQPFDEWYPLLPEMMKKRFYCVGFKSFGKCAGNYFNHSSGEYFAQTFKFDNSKNVEWLKVFGKDHFIDIMGTIKRTDGSYPVFTSSNKFFSHDGIHLTQAGAQEFARNINVIQYLH